MKFFNNKIRVVKKFNCKKMKSFVDFSNQLDIPILSFNGIECYNIEYNNDVQKSTLVTEFNLICDREWLSKLSISCGMLGIAIGAFCGGMFTDKYGRKTGIYIMTILSSIILFIQTYSPNIYAMGQI